MTSPDKPTYQESSASLDEYLAAAGRAHTHCRYCGRLLVDVTEPDQLFDQETGRRPLIVWRQCPRYPRNGLQAMIRGVHESFQLDNPAMGRQWR